MLIVLKDATFQFIDQKSGTHFKSLDELPSDARLCMESPYNDCGAMGRVSLKYPALHHKFDIEYIIQTAKHILTQQSWMKDRTLIRSVLHKWTLWAGDLHKNVSFLARRANSRKTLATLMMRLRWSFIFINIFFIDKEGLVQHC
ncbi:MAG: hypothetical protein ABSA44_10680 [Bacteroidota bacterium]|jgi:hypothetical protein